ncbi:MAG: hypothetical protein KTU85_09910 [Acidimicrobiia bacterium]|nr:hypothetical protein [Acidimicrobiia bacterium]
MPKDYCRVTRGVEKESGESKMILTAMRGHGFSGYDVYIAGRPTAYCLLPTAYCLLPTAYCLLPTAPPSTPARASRPPLPPPPPPRRAF